MAKQNKKPIPKRWLEVFESLPGYDPVATAAPGHWFDVTKADHAAQFFPVIVKHVKGAMYGKPFDLQPWQQAVVGCLFGWKRADGTRRYREVFIFIARKNGKTCFAAGLILYTLFCDNEAGAEIYGAASEYKQGCLVFEHARGMIKQEETLSNRCQVYNGQAKAITVEETLSSYRVVSSEAYSKHGYNTHLAVIDELHAQPDGELVDVMETSTANRRQPMIVYLTTSDFEREGSVCNEKHGYATKVRDGIIEVPEFLPCIFEAKLDDDWADPKVWKKANPNLGISVSEDYLEKACAKAKELPRFTNEFKRLHLNLRTEQSELWIPLDKWDACKSEYDAADLEGKECFAGLDLASTSDITALVLLFPMGDGEFRTLGFYWVPEAAIVKRTTRNHPFYATWKEAGHMRSTPGDMTDYAFVRKHINELGKQYRIREIAVDRFFQGAQLSNELQEQDGFEVVAFGQGFASMGAPSLEFEGLVRREKLRHNGDPVLRWMVSNICVKRDEAGNIKPDKKRSGDKIDGVVSTIMAIGRAAAGIKKETASVYETRGMIWI